MHTKLRHVFVRGLTLPKQTVLGAGRPHEVEKYESVFVCAKKTLKSELITVTQAFV